MRLILRIVMTLVGIIAFFAMAGSAAFWAYGQYGVPLVETQLQNAEDQIEASLEEEYPGADATVEFSEVFYKFEGTTLYVAFEVNATAEVGGVEVANETNYATVNVNSAIFGNAEYQTYEPSEWDDIQETFRIAPAILFDAEETKSSAIMYFSISAVVFVGSIVVKAVFLRRKFA
jgi:hypothetical protein